jgi:hypothetical protein
VKYESRGARERRRLRRPLEGPNERCAKIARRSPRAGRPPLPGGQRWPIEAARGEAERKERDACPTRATPRYERSSHLPAAKQEMVRSGRGRLRCGQRARGRSGGGTAARFSAGPVLRAWWGIALLGGTSGAAGGPWAAGFDARADRWPARTAAAASDSILREPGGGRRARSVESVARAAARPRSTATLCFAGDAVAPEADRSREAAAASAACRAERERWTWQDPGNRNGKRRGRASRALCRRRGAGMRDWSPNGRPVGAALVGPAGSPRGPTTPLRSSESRTGSRRGPRFSRLSTAHLRRALPSAASVGLMHFVRRS